MKTIAIIPARGGSKRIPKKNIKTFLGKPIIEYSIETALSCGLFNEVMVSTDNEEICKIAIRSGAKVPNLRSKRNSDDCATTVDVLLEVINDYETLGLHFDYSCCLYATAPFTTPKMLKEAFELLTDGNLDSVFPIIPFNPPIQRALKIIDGKKVEMLNPEHLMSRSQDLESTYHDAGQFYWFNTQMIMKKKKLWTDNSSSIILGSTEAHDIDSEDDWKIAEFKYRLRNEKL